MATDTFKSCRPATWLNVDEQLEQFEKLNKLCNWPQDAKNVARTIDPATAEVTCEYGDPDYPYAFLFRDFGNREGFGGGAYEELTWLLTHDHLFTLADKVNALRGLGEKLVRLYYARARVSSPYEEYAHEGVGRWIWFGDLPESVRDALYKKHDLPGNGYFKDLPAESGAGEAGSEESEQTV